MSQLICRRKLNQTATIVSIDSLFKSFLKQKWQNFTSSSSSISGCHSLMWVLKKYLISFGLLVRQNKIFDHHRQLVIFCWHFIDQTISTEDDSYYKNNRQLQGTLIQWLELDKKLELNFSADESNWWKLATILRIGYMFYSLLKYQLTKCKYFLLPYTSNYI